MRDPRFKAVHRGGELDPGRHRLLAAWAADCVEHVLRIFSEQCPQDDGPQKAVETARAWARGEVTVGEARSAAVEAHAAARNATDGAARAVARAAGHAAGTAHMADHALQAARYAVEAAANFADEMATDRERAWQEEQLPKALRALILPGAED